MAARKSQKPKTTVRLLKIAVQPVVILDDGKTLTERPIQPQVIPVDQWDQFTTEGFDGMLAELQRQVDEES